MDKMVDLGNGVHLVDVHDQDTTELTCSYLLTGGKIAFVETGATPGIPYLLSALNDIGAGPEAVEAIIVTHIHLDHAGGAGALARRCKNAKVYVHPRGARHLVDPSRLTAGAKAVYGDRFEKFFGEIVPVLQERVYTPADGEKLDLGEGRELTFYHSPGHAGHHMVVHDPSARGIFTGDAAGIRYYPLSRQIGRDYVLPSTPPVDFDPAVYVATLERILLLEPEYFYFTHYGRAENVPELVARNCDVLKASVTIAGEILERGGTVVEVEMALWGLVMGELAWDGVTDRNNPAVVRIGLDLELNAKGIVQYLEKTRGA
jgi:glyoxylase-like metal-dependent hydrolase (beta-lactamase superfamily II)